jgi:hypothetical protein
MGNARRCEDATGLWQVREEVPVDDDGGRAGDDTYTFAFDGDSVTVRLMTLHPGQLRSTDGFYRLSAECRGDALWYRPPFGDWVQLATFEDGGFVDVGSGRKRVFARIADSDVADWNRAILTPRPRHDYRTRPDGTIGS